MTDRLLPGSLRSAADLLQKVRRDAALLDDEVTSDRFFNFVVTAYSLIDWIDHDPTVPIAAKAPAEIAALRADQWLLLCGDAATGAKHFKLTRRTPTAVKVSVASGFGVGSYGKGEWGYRRGTHNGSHAGRTRLRGSRTRPGCSRHLGGFLLPSWNTSCVTPCRCLTSA